MVGIILRRVFELILGFTRLLADSLIQSEVLIQNQFEISHKWNDDFNYENQHFGFDGNGAFVKYKNLDYDFHTPQCTDLNILPSNGQSKLKQGSTNWTYPPDTHPSIHQQNPDKGSCSNLF